jgi:hypothetical protein
MSPGDHTIWFVPKMPYALSARRIFEHAQYRQVNPFAVSLAEVSSAATAAAVIDVVALRGDELELTGLTAAHLEYRERCLPVLGESRISLRLWAREGCGRRARAFVLRLARRHALRQATLRNLSMQGLRAEELQRSGLMAWLGRQDPEARLAGADLRAAFDLSGCGWPCCRTWKNRAPSCISRRPRRAPYPRRGAAGIASRTSVASCASSIASSAIASRPWSATASGARTAIGRP